MPAYSRSIICAVALIWVGALRPAPVDGQSPAQGGRRGGAPAQNARHDAREIAPDALIGTWILNLEKTKFGDGQRKPQSAYRTFDFTTDGKILCTNSSLTADGNRTFGHWIASLDGSEGLEFNRTSRSASTMVVSMKMLDERRLQVRAWRNGELMWEGGFTISEDGKTLRQQLQSTPAMGRITEIDNVYDKG
jgi:hypothetical protein